MNCWNDAKSRWTLPYNSIDDEKITYKIDLLDSDEDWKTYTSDTYDRAVNHFKLDGTHGMQLTLPGNYSATFIPSVARENNWDIKTYMRKLTLKAYGTNDTTKQDDWKNKNPNNIIRIYSSKHFVFNPTDNAINLL